MKENVFIMSSVHPWEDSRIFHKQAVSLAREYQVEYHAIGDFKMRELQGVKIYGLPKGRRWTRPLNWLRLLQRALKSKARVIHFHDPELLGLGVILRLFRRQVIYDIHEDLPAAILNKKWIKGRKIVAFLGDKVEKFLARRMTALVFAEEYYKENFTKVNVRKVDVLNYPLLSSPSSPQRPTDVYNLIYAGGITVARGALTMVEAVAGLPPELAEKTRLFLLGAVKPDLLNKIYTLAEDRGIREQVHCLGRVTFEEVYDYYSKSHLGLALLQPQPNYIKSLATKIFEYMSVGIPSVTSNFPLWRKLVDENECGLTADPLDPKDVSEKISELFTNPTLMEQMGQNGAEAFREKYNWAVEEKKLLALYKELIK